MGITLVTCLWLLSCVHEVPLPVPLPELSPDEAIQQICLSPEDPDLGIGDQVSMTLTFTPEEIVPHVVNWASSNIQVASVDENGVVTALTPGVAVISASAGHLADSVVVSVYPRRIPASGMKLSRTTLSLRQGSSFAVKASLIPENTTENKIFTWNSSLETVATVNDGIIHAVGIGETVISVHHKDLKDSILVTVSESVVFQDISSAWTLTTLAPQWEWDAGRNLLGAKEDVLLGGCDAFYHYFAVVHADRFDGIEKAADSLTALMEAMEEDGEDVTILFKKSEADTLTYSYPQTGNAVAYVLGVDEKLCLTGEYSQIRFKVQTPAPVPATGIEFWQGGVPVTRLTLQEGEQLDGVYARFKPDYCTDKWQEIRLVSSDEGLLKLTLEAGSCTLDARLKGSAIVQATFNGLSASLPVTITRQDDGWTDCSEQWSGHFGMVPLWGFDTFGFMLESCTSPKHVLMMIPASEIGDDLVYSCFKQKVPKTATRTASASIPDSTASFGNSSDRPYYVFIYGMDASGESFDGHYAIFRYVPQK